MIQRVRTLSSLICLAALTIFATGGLEDVDAAPVGLQAGTATYSQTISATFSPDQVYDNNYGNLNAWAILRSVAADPASALSETAVWETTGDIGPGLITFTMYHLHTNPQHLIGRFRWSVTTDLRANFADGVDSGGNISANWTVLTGPELVLPSGMTSTVLPDNSILTGGAVPSTGVYVVTYPLSMAGVTGIRLEVIEDASLPQNGPGHSPGNGNFQLTELQVGISPQVGDTGFVPPDGDTFKCEDAVAKNIAKLTSCIYKCHIAKVKAAFRGASFDEDACQSTHPSRSCRARYTAKAARIVASGGCPSCLGATQQSDLAAQVEIDLDLGNGSFYCEGTTPLSP